MWQPLVGYPNPDSWPDPKCRSPIELCNLRHRSTRVQNWGICFLDPPLRLGSLIFSLRKAAGEIREGTCLLFVVEEFKVSYKNP